MSLAHLRPEVHEFALSSNAERLAHFGAERWIGYTRANQALTRLTELFAREPGKIRPQNLLIVGPSNNGKTMIAEKFRRAHPPRNADNGDHEIIPVVTVQMPAVATVSRLYTALLVALGVPIGFYTRSDVREAQVLRLMRTVEVRMIVIDEVHNLLGAPAGRQREILNLLRFLGNELRIPLVCLGIRDAYLALRSDDQMENRFHPVLLPPWEIGEEFARLLTSFEAVLPLREPSHLAAAPLSELILRRTEGRIGEIASLLSHATATALLQETERIDPAIIERADYHPPGVRRNMMERELC